MSYFLDNKLYDYYEVNKFNVGSGYIEEPTIEILNNEEILFNFSQLEVKAVSVGILNYLDVETTKIHIDWGDGKIDRLSKPLIPKKSTIGTHKPNQWKIIKHLFNVPKKYEYKTNDTKYFHKIKITAFNSIDDRFVIEIPYKVLYKTIYDIGTEMSLFSANTTNSNKVSYTLKQNNNDSLIVINSLDWRTIYGNDNVEIIEETISDIFSNEFVNEDMMVWDWNSAPNIKFITIPDIVNRSITVNFESSGIPVESWYPHLVLLRDEGDISVKVDKNEDEPYEFVAKFGNQNGNESVTDTNFKKGIYKAYLNPLTGVNGVVTKSTDTFINYGMNNVLPRQLCYQKNKDEQDENIDVAFCNINNTTHEIEFKYKLPTNHQFCSLTKADLILEAYYTSGNHKGQKVDDVFFTFNLLSSFYDENKKPNFDENKNISYTIRMCDIPDKILVGEQHGEQKYESIKYVPSIFTNDVIDTEVDDNTYIYSESIEDGGIPKLTLTTESLGEINFTYEVGEFTKNSLSIKNDTNSKIDEKNIDVTWKFKPTDTTDWDQFQIILTEQSTGNIICNDVHTFNDNTKSFQGLITESVNGDYSFKKILDGNKIPDGKLKCDIIYKVVMGNYYDSRSATITTDSDYEYSYAAPEIQITDIQPHVKINYDRINNEQSLILCHTITGNSPNDTVKNIKLIEKYNDKESTTNVSSLNYTYSNVPISKNNLSYTFKAANKNDLYERDGSSLEASYSNYLSSDDILKLPHDGVDYLNISEGDLLLVPKNTIGNDTEMPVSRSWVKENTLFDIDKFYKFTNQKNKKIYYGHKDCGEFKFNENQRFLVYDIVEIIQGSQTHRRFRPVLMDNSTQWTKNELSLQKDFINITSSRIYDGSNDCGKLLIDWSKSTFDKNLVKRLTLKLYKNEEYDKWYQYDSSSNEFSEITDRIENSDVEKITIDGYDVYEYNGSIDGIPSIIFKNKSDNEWYSYNSSSNEFSEITGTIEDSAVEQITIDGYDVYEYNGSIDGIPSIIFKKNNYELLYSEQVKGLSSYTFENLDFGKYKAELVLDSEEVKTDTKGKDSNDENVMLKPNEAISFLGNPMISRTVDGTYAYVSWKWNLKHKKCTDIKLIYEYTYNGKSESKIIDYIKTQNIGQSIKIPVKSHDGTNTKINYHFEIVSPHFIDDDGNHINEFIVDDENNKIYNYQEILADSIELS